MFDLTGRTALVTGATGGIGGAIAKALHAQGATVAVSGTRREALETLAGELKDRVHVLPCNLSNMDDVEALVDEATSPLQHAAIHLETVAVDRHVGQVLGLETLAGSLRLIEAHPHEVEGEEGGTGGEERHDAHEDAENLSLATGR